VNRLSFFACAFLLICTACSTGKPDFEPATSVVTDNSAEAGRYIVGLNASAGKGTSAVSKVTSELKAAPDQVFDTALSGFAGTLTADEATRLKADPRVAFVEPDIKIHAQIQYLPWGVNRIDAEQNSKWKAGTGGAGIGVAVLDTGIQTSHPDLVGAVVGNHNATGQGTFYDGNGHGTHVAGIIGARKNTIGYVGVAPACNMVNVTVMGADGSGYLSWAISGINWVISKKSVYNIKVANMSLGVSATSQALETACINAKNAGIVIVAAAGNAGTNAGGYIPAKYSSVVCVSAMTSNNNFAYYSNYGSVVDLIAPGSGIPSTWINSGYANSSGTSMAAPHVAGAFALWFDNHSGTFSQALAAVKAAGEPGSWPGDPDGIHEKLVDAWYL
jgi:subtilisin family serine protease